MDDLTMIIVITPEIFLQTTSGRKNATESLKIWQGVLFAFDATI
jgi:hypothetical protein